MSSVAALRSAPSTARSSSRSEVRVPRRHTVVRAQKVEEAQQAGVTDEARVPSPAVNVIQTHPVPRLEAPLTAASMPHMFAEPPPPPALHLPKLDRTLLARFAWFRGAGGRRASLLPWAATSCPLVSSPEQLTASPPVVHTMQLRAA